MVRTALLTGILLAAWLSQAAAAAPPQLDPTPLAEASAEEAWAGDLRPIPDAAWNERRAYHLLERAGFGGTPEEVEALAALPPREAVRRLVRWQEQPATPIAAFVESGIFPGGEDFVPPLDGDLPGLITRGVVLRRALGVKIRWNFDEPFLQPVFDQFFYLLAANSLEITRVSHWQAGRMVLTRRPLEEKLALFWHGHFATENEKVRDYRKMKAQWELFRAHGNGSFRELLLGISRDPAMLIYLDGIKNVRGDPNENYAREILELFTMGVGHYEEEDVQEVARAFTGWGLDGNEFDRSWWKHDKRRKTVLGRSGRLDGEDVIDVILEQPATAEFIAGKLYRYFVREETPPPALRAALARTLRESGYELSPLLEQIFLSRDFYSEASVGTRVKGPVELVVSTYRKLGVPEMPGAPHFHTTTDRMGQALFAPPNVAGWQGGRSWINPSTLIERQNFARHALFPGEIPPLERSLHEIIVTAIVGPALYGEMKKLDAMGDRRTPPRIPDPETGFARAGLQGQETFNLAWAVYTGTEKAIGAIRFDSPVIARFSLVEMMRSARVEDAPGAVDHLTRRFLAVPLDARDRAELTAYLEARLGGRQLDLEREATERDLRELLHVILSLPEYQLS